MPCIELRINNRTFRIDSADQQMCGRWIMDVLMMYPITPADALILRVMPFLIAHPSDPSGQVREIPDWCCDARKLETWGIANITSPADAARKLAARLDHFAAQLEPEDQQTERV